MCKEKKKSRKTKIEVDKINENLDKIDKKMRKVRRDFKRKSKRSEISFRKLYSINNQ